MKTNKETEALEEIRRSCGANLSYFPEGVDYIILDICKTACMGLGDVETIKKIDKYLKQNHIAWKARR